MKVVLLAGGSATRMAPFSAWTEKSLLPINGKPIIRIIMERIAHSLVKQCYERKEQLEFYICILGKYRENFEWDFRDWLHPYGDGVEVSKLRFSEKVDAIGTATHYYFAAEKEFHFKPDETVLIHYADALTELDYAHFLKVFEEKEECEALVAITENARHDYSEVIIRNKAYDDQGQGYHIGPQQAVPVIEFHEKPMLIRPTWTGIMLLKHRVMQEEFGNPLFADKWDFGHHVLPALTKKEKLYAYLYQGEWLDVGNLHSYSKAVEKYRGGSLFT